MAKTTVALLALTLLNAGCDLLESPAVTCYYVGNSIEMFAEELSRRGIAFEKTDRRECLSVFGLDEATHKEIRDQLFGTPPPEGLNISWPRQLHGVVDGQTFELNESERIMKQLEKANIETEVISFYGEKYLVWDKADDAIVRKILENRL